MTFRQERDGTLTRVSEAPTAAQESCNTALPLDDSPHSTDVWSTARALTVLRESLFSDNPVTSKALEDAARYLGEFGGVRSRAEAKSRYDRAMEARNSSFDMGCDSIMRSDEYREGERVVRLREAFRKRNEKRRASRKTSKKVKHG